ncbi:hypothetical protein EMCRGX_G013735 [Ephydatia muelleri]
MIRRVFADSLDECGTGILPKDWLCWGATKHWDLSAGLSVCTLYMGPLLDRTKSCGQGSVGVRHPCKSASELDTKKRLIASGWMPVCLSKPRASLSREDTALAARVLANSVSWCTSSGYLTDLCVTPALLS